MEHVERGNSNHYTSQLSLAEKHLLYNLASATTPYHSSLLYNLVSATTTHHSCLWQRNIYCTTWPQPPLHISAVSGRETSTVQPGLSHHYISQLSTVQPDLSHHYISQLSLAEKHLLYNLASATTTHHSSLLYNLVSATTTYHSCLCNTNIYRTTWSQPPLHFTAVYCTTWSQIPLHITAVCGRETSTVQPDLSHHYISQLSLAEKHLLYNLASATTTHHSCLWQRNIYCTTWSQPPIHITAVSGRETSTVQPGLSHHYTSQLSVKQKNLLYNLVLAITTHHSCLWQRNIYCTTWPQPPLHITAVCGRETSTVQPGLSHQYTSQLSVAEKHLLYNLVSATTTYHSCL